LARYALDLHSHGHLDRSISLGHLAQNLYEQFTLFGGIEHINEAATFLDQKALGLHPPVHSDREIALKDAVIRFNIRYEMLEETSDLDHLIALCQDALALFLLGHRDRDWVVYHFALYLSQRFIHVGVIEDLNEGTVLDPEACVKGVFLITARS
ncbi:hypothetical protein V8E55_003101, partial [Tylopilus felleus]